jgi:membrane-associated phospholipid phosphatase
VTSHAAAIGQRLPRGWTHLALQFAIWIGFYGAYQLARGAADRSVAQAFEHGREIIELQYRLGSLVEPSLQRAVEQSSLLVEATAYTYWLSQFAVVGLALLWVYFARHERFYYFRNTLIVANLLGLLGYVLLPTAPPRMFPEWGFTDTLAEHAAVDHESVAALANPYAAMPSLHAMDAVIVSIVMVSLVRNRLAKLVWALWAPWVWFAVMSTGNHFWLDCAAGALIALVVGAVVYRDRLWGRTAETARA